MRQATSIAAFTLLLLTGGCSTPVGRPASLDARGSTGAYPPHWFSPVPEDQAASWEILPQAAGPGEVILSKRNELGLLSNFAPTPFVYHEKRYASVEGFWQMMKYPEGPADERATFPGITWAHTREDVSRMTSFEAKAAGDLGSANMKSMGIDWVTFEGERFPYWSAERGRHYALIAEAMREKLRQNEDVRTVLLATGDLVLRPDHRQPADAPPEWRYYEIWMELRDSLRAGSVSPAPGAR